jgi:demethylmenaquinone methyltransferase/2-methoxy-6-polyprenyl-1,4-benzoquinol methylase
MTNINQAKFKKATKVFNSVFNKYDIMNDLMSLGIHRLWKKRLIEWMNPKKDDHLIDMAAGTGDIANAFLSRIKNQGYVSCVDPNKLMIEQGRKKLKHLNNIQWHVSSAENLPFKDNMFDIYSVSFGVRNFSDTQKALREAHRVLKSGGRFICLEFSKVENEILNKVYKTYSKTIPFIGKYIVGDSEPYDYLIKTIDEFYDQESFKKIILDNGFNNVEYRNLSGGIVAIHSAWKI